MGYGSRFRKRYSTGGRKQVAYDLMKLGAIAALGYGINDWRNRGKEIEELEKELVDRGHISYRLKDKEQREYFKSFSEKPKLFKPTYIPAEYTEREEAENNKNKVPEDNTGTKSGFGRRKRKSKRSCRKKSKSCKRRKSRKY